MSDQGDVKKDFLQVKESVEKEIQKLSQTLAKHEKLVKRMKLLEEKDKTSGHSTTDPPISAETAETVKTAMQLICNFADVLKMRKENPDPIAVHELETVQKQLTNEMGKFDLVQEYVSDGCNAAEAASNTSFDGELMSPESHESPFLPKDASTNM